MMGKSDHGFWADKMAFMRSAAALFTASSATRTPPHPFSIRPIISFTSEQITDVMPVVDKTSRALDASAPVGVRIATAISAGANVLITSRLFRHHLRCMPPERGRSSQHSVKISQGLSHAHTRLIHLKFPDRFLVSADAFLDH